MKKKSTLMKTSSKQPQWVKEKPMGNTTGSRTQLAFPMQTITNPHRAAERKGPQMTLDDDTRACLEHMGVDRETQSYHVKGVRFVLVVLSAGGMVYDIEALRQKIELSYPDAAVFFLTTQGKPIGPVAPRQVDLLIDFTGPSQRQGFFYALKLKRMARIAVGRNVGLFRRRIYDRIFDEIKEKDQVPIELLQRERFVQKKILSLAGVAFIQAGETPPDRGKSIALELPAMKDFSS